ncbi:unnamed protein product [Cuscuta campestris]|uniref:Uncharacterized protein n=1 Tax=Cuscuta campestris TaxID=132261 RepID=A0A484N8G3_9ASTE|nr:unnamed protein product [Cuscuta campestris]
MAGKSFSRKFLTQFLKKINYKVQFKVISRDVLQPAYAILKNFLQKLGLQGEFSIGTLSFNQRALSIIASDLGRPLKVDESTLRFSRPELARFCVEIDVSKPPPSKIHINLNQERELKQPVQIRENKGKEIIGEKWTVITSKRGGSEAVWKRKLGPSSGPGECSNSCEAQQLQDKDKDKETPVPVVHCPAPPTSAPTSALLDHTPPQGTEVSPDSEGNNMALVLRKPLPIAESKFSPLLQLEEENESDESDYEDLGIKYDYPCNSKSLPPITEKVKEIQLNTSIKSRLRSANKSSNHSVSQ